MLVPMGTSESTAARQQQKQQQQVLQRRPSTLLRTVVQPRFLFVCLAMAALWFFVLLNSHITLVHDTPNIEKDKKRAQRVALPFMKNKDKASLERVVLHKPQEELTTDAWQSAASKLILPDAFEAVLERAREKEDYCNNGDKVVSFAEMDKSFEIPFRNGTTVASLPSFGIIDILQVWKDDPPHAEGLDGGEKDELTRRFNNWNACQLPPETSCHESKFSVIFMAYNPDRLQETFAQIHKMCTAPEWTAMVHEVILVWNGPRHVNETDEGRTLLDFAQESTSTTTDTTTTRTVAPLRVEYPLLLGLENDLMNRYHPGVVQVKTKAILYYDDDGPFYSSSAVRGGFELWKRHSRAQIGAMSRQIDYSPRQVQEHASLLSSTSTTSIPPDQHFVSHCTNAKDQVEYNFKYFANYDANMVLPSGSLLHSNYLCFLWHPVLEPIRHFVRQHPVHPDDVTVSMVVSQLGGRAPRVYPRRLNRVDKSVQDERRRRLSIQQQEQIDDIVDDEEGKEEWPWQPELQQKQQQQQQLPSLDHRRLMFNIDWDAGAGMNDNKRYWADLRTGATNAVVRYFGSINSGSIGWCEGTKYYDAKVDGRCHPVMARIGWLPWMNPDGTPKETCP
jgi:Glycosyl transferase family 64 domain